MTPTELLAIRHALGLSQQGLADALGISGILGRQTVSRWERGVRAITSRTSHSVLALQIARNPRRWG